MKASVKHLVIGNMAGLGVIGVVVFLAFKAHWLVGWIVLAAILHRISKIAFELSDEAEAKEGE